MQREIQLTADGSHTVFIPDRRVTYHSKHGAIGESMHVFIQAGLLPLIAQPAHTFLTILEMGFGTGLNALLSLQTAIQYKVPLAYTGLEIFPLLQQETDTLNYGQLLSMAPSFQQIHSCPWEQEVQLDTFFTLQKRKLSLLDFNTALLFNCIYFDAFAPDIQPEIWTQAVFEKLFSQLSPGGVLVTYCSKSTVRHAMTAAGFTVEKLPGPRGKREMVRALKK